MGDTDIQGKNIGACLGDAMSVGWMMDSDKNFDESLNAQFQTVYKWSMTSRCNPIPCFNMPCMYGDTKIANEAVGNFQGQSSAVLDAVNVSRIQKPTGAINARDVKLQLLKHRANMSNSDAAWELVHMEEAHRQNIDNFFTGLAQAVCQGNTCDAAMLVGQVKAVGATYENCHPASTIDLACHKALIDAISSPQCER